MMTTYFGEVDFCDIRKGLTSELIEPAATAGGAFRSHGSVAVFS
jgi:hypothetical protein